MNHKTANKKCVTLKIDIPDFSEFFFFFFKKKNAEKKALSYLTFIATILYTYSLLQPFFTLILY